MLDGMSPDTQGPPAPPPAPAGRRERKKAELRRAISDVATRMFVERGFDAVTLAEVAEAADVSIKTIFNHFGSKEELFLDRDAEVSAGDPGRDPRPPARPGRGRGAARPAHRARASPARAGPRCADPACYRRLQRFLATWHASVSLQGRHLLWTERLQDDLCALLADELGADPDEDRVQVMGATLAGAIHLRQRTFAAAVLAGAPPEEVERRVRAICAEALGRATVAFPSSSATIALARAGSAGSPAGCLGAPAARSARRTSGGSRWPAGARPATSGCPGS